MNSNNPRRDFLKMFALAVGALLVAPVANLTKVFAEPVKANDPLAKALGYTEDASKAADRKDKKAMCGNCQFFGDATGKAARAKCQLIASGDVNQKGWCRSYSARAGVKPAEKAKAKKS